MKKIRDIERRWKWARGAKQICFICGKPPGGFGYHLEIMHIIGGSGRSDVEANLAWGHHACHSSTHGIQETISGVKTPVYTRLDILKGKKRLDPKYWNPAILEELMGHKILELEQM